MTSRGPRPLPTQPRPGPPIDDGPAEIDLEQLYQQAPCGYLVITDDGTITSVNDTFLGWTGHSRADLVGTAFPRLLPVGARILFSTHCMPQLLMTGAVAEIVIDVIGPMEPAGPRCSPRLAPRPPTGCPRASG